MNNDEKIVQLLAEIRDNQRGQLEWSKGAMERQRRRSLITAIVFGIGVALLLYAMHLQ